MDRPQERRYTTVVTDTEGVRRNTGRLRLGYDGDTAVLADPRSGEVRHSMVLADASLHRRVWTLTGEDGSTFVLSGCGCGGR